MVGARRHFSINSAAEHLSEPLFVCDFKVAYLGQGPTGFYTVILPSDQPGSQLDHRPTVTM